MEETDINCDNCSWKDKCEKDFECRVKVVVEDLGMVKKEEN